MPLVFKHEGLGASWQPTGGRPSSAGSLKGRMPLSLSPCYSAMNEPAPKVAWMSSGCMSGLDTGKSTPATCSPGTLSAINSPRSCSSVTSWETTRTPCIRPEEWEEKVGSVLKRLEQLGQLNYDDDDEEEARADEAKQPQKVVVGPSIPVRQPHATEKRGCTDKSKSKLGRPTSMPPRTSTLDPERWKGAARRILSKAPIAHAEENVVDGVNRESHPQSGLRNMFRLAKFGNFHSR
eukprot:gnl/TRDRNA2_/TRDRNA2_165444_c1_seq1.p1 gnl/TRDRNA2_/TRDRNA2_165444_c1~~gnl/TRDRNA2_/TRDRNA2_165444_c1_seq1.p1  ORF type:complete len:236 (+),score=38.29 gnl/TRDRNA2_/TRDRNA2_165444_c1_seq1:1-708(+)